MSLWRLFGSGFGLVAVVVMGGASDPPMMATVPVVACHLRYTAAGDLPDPACTPGALNPTVTQDTIGSTICIAHWTAGVRPPVWVTARLKKQLLAAYGLPSGELSELDHLVSLELGGAPTDLRNLWPEPGGIPNDKDRVEGTLHRAVCAHRVTLAAAQQAIARDWTTAEQVLGLPDTFDPSGAITSREHDALADMLTTCGKDN
jgi:hypothetical protein